MAKRPKKGFKARVSEPRFRINMQIRVPEIRLVGDNLDEISKAAGEKIETGVLSTRKAYKLAEMAGLDLVEISPNAKPPVCKITDYQKFLFQRKKRDKEIKSNAVKTVIKEIRFGPNTDDHDFEFKIRYAEKFLESGYKVKAFVQFRGRAIVFKERGELLLLRFIQKLGDLGTPEALPKMEGRRMFVFIAPKKSPKKKGTPKKNSKSSKDKAKAKAKAAERSKAAENTDKPKAIDNAVVDPKAADNTAKPKAVDNAAVSPKAADNSDKPKAVDKTAVDPKAADNTAKPKAVDKTADKPKES